MKKKDNQKLVGLSKKIDDLLSEHSLSTLKIRELILEPKIEVNSKSNELNGCRLVRDPETGELIWICD